MTPAQYLQDLEQRGIRLDYRLKIDAPTNSLQTHDRKQLQQLKPLLAKLLAENELTAYAAKQGKEAEQPNSPASSTARLHMMDKRGCVTHDETKCYMWTRELKGYGWWYASDYPPPLT